MTKFLDDDKEHWLYMDETIKSQGFYVPNNYGAYIPCGIVRIKKEDEPTKYKKAKCAAEYAVEKHNNVEGNNKLVLLKVKNVNMEAAAGALYYITFKAMDPYSYEVNTYQTKVLEKLNTGFHVQIFRLAPDSYSNIEYISYSSVQIKDEVICIESN